MTVLDDCEALKTFEEIYECINREGQAVLYIKGSPEGSSESEFQSSILCDVIEISAWLISRPTQNWLKMTSFMSDPPLSDIDFKREMDSPPNYP